MNSIIIVGRVTRKPSLSTTNDGKNYCKFIVAVNKNKTEANYFTCVAWKNQAEVVAKFLEQGSLVGVRGSMESHSYEKDGKKLTAWEILVSECQFLSGKEEQPQENDDGLPF